MVRYIRKIGKQISINSINQHYQLIVSIDVYITMWPHVLVLMLPYVSLSIASPAAVAG